eukprot:5816330-Prymnesium_polylepis.2
MTQHGETEAASRAPRDTAWAVGCTLTSDSGPIAAPRAVHASSRCHLRHPSPATIRSRTICSDVLMARLNMFLEPRGVVVASGSVGHVPKAPKRALIEPPMGLTSRAGMTAPSMVERCHALRLQCHLTHLAHRPLLPPHSLLCSHRGPHFRREYILLRMSQSFASL